MNSFLINPHEIAVINDLWPREQLDQARVYEFADLYEEEGAEVLPPIKVTAPNKDGRRVLVDGWHRIEAAIMAEIENLPAVECEAKTPAEIFFQATKDSSIGTKLLTSQEKWAAVVRILSETPQKSDREVGKAVGFSHTTIATIRKSLTVPNAETPATENTGTPRQSQTAEKAADKIFKDVKTFLDSGLFLWKPDKNRAKVLRESAIKFFGDDAKNVLAKLENWSRIAKEACEAPSDSG